MKQPVHVIDQADLQATPALLAYLMDKLSAEGLSPRDHLLLLGGSGLRAIARSVGLKDVPIHNARVAHGLFGLPGLRRALQDIPRTMPLHAWSIPTLRAMHRLRPQSELTVHFYTTPAQRELLWLRDRRQQGVQVRAIGESQRDALIEVGVPAHRVVADPLMSLSQAKKWLVGERGQIRSGWGISDDQPVIALLSDPPSAVDVLPSILTVSFIAEIKKSHPMLLVHPDQHQRPRAQRLLDLRRANFGLLQDARIATPWQLMRGCDAVLLFDEPAPLAARFACAAGVPVVAPDLPTHREALSGGSQISFVNSLEPKHLADRLQHQAMSQLYASGLGVSV